MSRTESGFVPPEDENFPVARAIQTGIERHQAGRLAEAEHIYRRILKFEPGNVEALHLLGIVMSQLGRLDAGVELIGKALAAQPTNPIFLNNLANALKDCGRRADAEACYRKAISLKPDYAEAHANLGNLLLHAGHPGDAADSYRKALEVRPDYPEALVNLGNALQSPGGSVDAEQCYRKALSLRPNYVEALVNLAQALRGQGRLLEAEQSLRAALAIRPEIAEAHNYLANVLRSLGQVDEAEQSYRRALALKPDDAETYSNLLFLLNYIPDRTPEQIFAEHQEFARRFVPGIKPAPHTNAPKPTRKLRIGYVSADLRDHPVAFFLEPVLAHHNRRKFEIYSYYNFAHGDLVTTRLKSLSDHWREVAALDDDALAKLIRDDAIDILVDLSGHTGHNRLLTFARKPVPVQATWLGYLNTTGLEQMDYRITDARATPRGPLDALNSEKLVRLPDTQCCYRPPQAPDVSPPPCVASGHVTFASFTNPAKIGQTSIELWGRVLKRVPSARLLVVGATSVTLSPEFVRRFLLAGISSERIEIVGARPFPEYLALHGKVDIILDTFPYSSGTTTCHALWMGVPVVTLAGDSASSRTGTNLLHALGLKALVARAPEHYVEIAVALAADSGRLAKLRAGMRKRMAASPLMDETQFTQNLEKAYRAMWCSWCARQHS
jgi:predicted O-linked N-acetylglucosamine transferase (SPINDLY family)